MLPPWRGEFVGISSAPSSSASSACSRVAAAATSLPSASRGGTRPRCNASTRAPSRKAPGVVRVRAIRGPGVCGADFPLKVSILGESAPLGYTDDLRPPGDIPRSAGSAPARWPIRPSSVPAPAQEPPPPYQSRVLPEYQPRAGGQPPDQPVSLDPPGVTGPRQRRAGELRLSPTLRGARLPRRPPTYRPPPPRARPARTSRPSRTSAARWSTRRACRAIPPAASPALRCARRRSPTRRPPRRARPRPWTLPAGASRRRSFRSVPLADAPIDRRRRAGRRQPGGDARVPDGLRARSLDRRRRAAGGDALVRFAGRRDHADFRLFLPRHERQSARAAFPSTPSATRSTSRPSRSPTDARSR